MNDLDYAKKYAELLRKNPQLFQQQKQFLEAQYQASHSLFQNFPKRAFKKHARAYLKGRGLI